LSTSLDVDVNNVSISEDSGLIGEAGGLAFAFGWEKPAIVDCFEGVSGKRWMNRNEFGADMKFHRLTIVAEACGV
jgi:hypothetical protein